MISLHQIWRALGARAKGERLTAIKASPQWNGRRFVTGLPDDIDFPYLWRRFWRRSQHRIPQPGLPVFSADVQALQALPASGLRLTWLGHSTLYVELDGLRLLLDPVWCPRASPAPQVGPRRFFEPPLALQDLPRPDAVLISHDHYDHLDEPTLRAMRDWDTLFVVPLGVGAHLELWGIAPERIVEKDWWGELQLKGVTLACTPARHFSGRGILDRYKTLWCSWSLVGPQHRYFFSGDSAWFDGYHEIGKRYGPFDACSIESGAYDPSWSDLHGGPEQAVNAALALKAKLLLPIHWGTFNLAFHSWTEPAERVLAAAEAKGQPVIIPRPGQSVEPASPPLLERWWPELPWETSEESPMVSRGKK